MHQLCVALLLAFVAPRVESHEMRKSSIPEGSSTTSAQPCDTLQEAAALATKMPFYLALACFPVKFVLTVSALGVDKTDKPKSIIGRGILWFTVISVIVTCLHDILEIKVMLGNTEFSFWEKLNFTMLTFGTSSNVVSFGMLCALNQFFRGIAVWRKAHGLPLGSESELGDRVLPGALRPITAVLHGIGVVFLIVPLTLYCIPAAIAYCYIFVPFYFVVSDGAFRLVDFIYWSKKVSGMQPVVEVNEAARAFLKETEYGKIMANNYEQEAEYFLVTGAPHAAWHQYVFLPLFTSALPFFVTLAVRLYTGRGYMNSLGLTLGERHAMVYFNSLVDSALDATEKAQEMHVFGTSGMLILTQRWLIFMSLLI